MLAAAGISSETQLRKLGAIAAFVAIKQAGESPSLNLLWAMEGALTDRDWRDIANNDRLELLIQLEDFENNMKQK